MCKFGELKIDTKPLKLRIGVSDAVPFETADSCIKVWQHVFLNMQSKNVLKFEKFIAFILVVHVYFNRKNKRKDGKKIWRSG